MAIATAVQRGNSVYVYNEQGNQIGGPINAGSGPKDGLQGYTSTTVSVRRDNSVYVYNEQGNQIGGPINAGS